MANHQELPPWLARLRTKVASTPEFKALSAELYREIRDSVRADGLPSFSDLSDEERQVLVGRARSSLLEHEAHGAARDAAWRALDVALDAEAETWLSERQAHSAKRPTKVDALVELAGTGATTLLARWPESGQSQLLWLLNADLPAPLRTALWQLKLSAPAARAEFERRRAESRLAVISLRDAAVMEHCQAVLQGAEPLLASRLPLMRAALSYLDALAPLEEVAPSASGASLAAALAARERPSQAEQAEERAPPPLECYWVLPLLRVFGDGGEEAAMIEAVTALLNAPKPTLDISPSIAAALADPGAAARSAGDAGDAAAEEAPLVDALLAEADPQFAEALSGAVGDVGGFLQPAAQRLGVGVFSAAATAYAWDVCLLGGWQQLQPLLAALLLALKDGLLGCASEEAAAAHLAQEGPRVPVGTLQPLMERHFLPAMRDSLGGVPAAVGDEGLTLWTTHGSAESPAVGN